MAHPALQMYDYHVWANQTMLNRFKRASTGRIQ